ncbi:hypothetical protein HUJ05_011211 [Dendroctonus ponderosae]|nr:hypothetical protein HUJ05_011211 [Dendroctonus ponderosae]
MSAGRTVVLGRGFPLELRLLSALLQRKRLARAVALGALLLHLGSLLHSLQGKYWVYSRASQLRNDVVIFINTVSDLLLVSVNVLGLLPLLGSPFLLELLRFCTAPLEVLGPSRACSPWINLLRFGPLLPIVTGGCLFSRNAGWASYQYFLGRQVWYYVMNLVVCAFICAALQLKWQFTRINDFLGRGGGASAAQLQLVAARFNGLCNLLDEFNRTFKALMVLVVMCVTGSVLHNCTSLIEYAAKPKGAAVKLATFLTQPLFALTTVAVRMWERVQLVCPAFPELQLFLQARHHHRLFRCAQVALIVAHVALFGYGQLGKPLVYGRFLPFGNHVVAFAALMNDLMVLAHLVFTVLATTSTRALADLIAAVLQERATKSHCAFHLCVALLRLLPIAPIGFGVWLYWDLYPYLLHRDVCYYSLNLTIYSCAGLLHKINGSFGAVNDQLEQLGAQLGRQHWRLILNRLARLRASFNVLYQLLDTFNSYVKALLVVVVTCISINILFNLTVITQFAVKPGDAYSTTLIYVIHALFILMSVGQAAVVAFVGEGLEEEGERTTRICFTLLNQLDHAQGKSEPLVARELRFILEHSRARKICLHAGGFFRLNWGILGSITSTVATYSIVIIQFLLK